MRNLCFVGALTIKRFIFALSAAALFGLGGCGSPFDLSSNQNLGLKPADNNILAFGVTGNRIASQIDQLGIEKFLAAQANSPTLTVQKATVAAGLNGSDSRQKYVFLEDGIEIFGAEVRAIKTITDTGEPGELLALLGSVPKHESISQSAWPRLAAASDSAVLTLRAYAIDLIISPDLQNHPDTKKIWFQNTEGEGLRAAWYFEAKSQTGLSYAVIADGQQALWHQPLYFELMNTEAQATIFDKNVDDGTAITVAIPFMTGDNTLTNTYFSTVIYGPAQSQYSRAVGTNNVFNFAPDTSEFVQTSVFTNAWRTFNWFSGLGFEEFGTRQMELEVHSRPLGTRNNALYESTTSGPKISIGDGDGVELTNLATDTDVVSHEFSHHVIFQRLTSTTGESLVMHEGLADYFTFARTGDACLGESICGANGSACFIDGCLRTGDNDYTLPQMSNRLEHIRSQFLSGMLWRVRSLATTDTTEFDRLVFDAVMSLLSNSGYSHFSASLLLSDSQLYQGKYCQDLYSEMIARGLENYLVASDGQAITCDALPASVTEVESPARQTASTTNSNSPSDAETASRSTKKGSSGFCGIAELSTNASHLPVVALLLLPLLCVSLVPVKGRHLSTPRSKKRQG